MNILLELAQKTASKNFRFALFDLRLVDQCNLGSTMVLDVEKAVDDATLLAFNKHFYSAIRQLQQLQHRRDCTHTIEPVFAWVVVGRILLGQEQYLLVASHGGFKGLDGFLPPNEQRNHHVRVDHYVAQRQKGQFDGCLHKFSSTTAIRR